MNFENLFPGSVSDTHLSDTNGRDFARLLRLDESEDEADIWNFRDTYESFSREVPKNISIFPVYIRFLILYKCISQCSDGNKLQGTTRW